MTNTDKALALLESIECHIAEAATAIANADAAADELTATLPDALPDEAKEHLTFLSSHLSLLATLCAKVENNSSDLQYELITPL